MKVIICGAGQVGYGIAERLSQEDNDVSVIDTSASLVTHITETLDVRGYVGHGAHPDMLARAGADQADMIIAVTLYDEVNIVACEVAHALFSVPTKIARIRAQNYLRPEYADLFSRQNMSIDVTISPEIEVGKMVLRRISFPGATDIVRFADDHITMVAIECMEDCPVVNTPLQQLSQLFPDLMATVTAIYRNGRLQVARSTDQLLVGDRDIPNQGFERQFYVDPLHRFLGDLMDYLPTDDLFALGNELSQGDVFSYGQVGEQGQVLVDHFDPFMDRIDGVVTVLGLAGDLDRRAVVGLDGAGDDLDQGGLTRSIFASQAMHLAFENLKIDIVQGGHTGVVFTDIPEGEERLAHSMISPVLSDIFTEVACMRLKERTSRNRFQGQPGEFNDASIGYDFF